MKNSQYVERFFWFRPGEKTTNPKDEEQTGKQQRRDPPGGIVVGDGIDCLRVVRGLVEDESDVVRGVADRFVVGRVEGVRGHGDSSCGAGLLGWDS